MTNIEYLRTLSAEELAVNVFWADEREGSCEICAKNVKGKPCGGKCVDGIMEWLNSEYKPELKSCPFCGGEAFIDEYANIKHYVVCKNCEANTRAGTETEAIEAWNRRANA